MDPDNNDVSIKLKKDGTPAKARGVRSGVKRGVYKTGKKRLKQKIVREAKAVLKSFPGQIPVDLRLSDEVIRSVENLKNGGNGIIPIGPNAREEAIVTRVDTESFIKKLKDAFEWEPQWFAELSKCAADPIYFIENYYTIISLDHGMIRMRLRPYQKDFIKALAALTTPATLAAAVQPAGLTRNTVCPVEDFTRDRDVTPGRGQSDGGQVTLVVFKDIEDGLHRGIIP